jgi:hypothetical protein
MLGHAGDTLQGDIERKLDRLEIYFTEVMGCAKDLTGRIAPAQAAGAVDAAKGSVLILDGAWTHTCWFCDQQAFRASRLRETKLKPNAFRI